MSSCIWFPGYDFCSGFWTFWFCCLPLLKSVYSAHVSDFSFWALQYVLPQLGCSWSQPPRPQYGPGPCIQQPAETDTRTLYTGTPVHGRPNKDNNVPSAARNWTSITSPPLPKPETYSGYPETSRGFLLQLYFAAYPNLTDQHKLTLFLTLLLGEALKWATAIRESGEAMTTHDQFISRFRHVFDHIPEGMEVTEQRKQRPLEYAKILHISSQEWMEFHGIPSILSEGTTRKCTQQVDVPRGKALPYLIHRSSGSTT